MPHPLFRRHSSILFALLFLSACARKGDAPATTVAEAPADVLFTGGKVYTLDESQPWAEAVAVKDNKIVFVGDAMGAKAFIGESTEVIDTTGKTVMPGFVSGHDHVVGAGWLLAGVNLGGAKSREEILQRVKQYADANPDLDYVLGNGWTFEAVGGRPTAAMLDAIVPDRPAILTDFTCHEAWLNTAALRLGNVTKDTPDVLPGTIYWERDAKGNPTGLGLEFQWLPTYVQSGAWQPERGFRESIDTMMGVAAKNGTTSVQVTGVVSPVFTNWEGQKKDFALAMEILTELKEQRDLLLRVRPMPIYKDVSATVEGFVGYAVEMSKKYDDDLLRVQSIKIHPEGNWTAHAAPMVEPYIDDGTKGGFGVEPERTMALTLKANEMGLNTIIHTDGDASARAAIDAFEAAKKAGYTDIRNALHHLIWIHPDDYARVLEMKIPVNSTPGFGNDWGGQDEMAYEMLGPERTEAELSRYPDLAREGIKVSLSADVLSTPLSSQAPLFVVEAAVTMMEPSEQGQSKPFPKTRKGLTIEQALRTITIDAAWHLQMEDKIGSLEVGKLADIVVLGENPLETDPLQLAEIKVLGTMMDGRFTHRDGI